ncbi:MFS transporter small subunit [Demequina zhanjiangensis]|uniref:EamA family transporter n=1 Tax=Demequina zhanjiangensis TaxID=3051659 RepID=A0ABT8G178_9MICO|nr:hypothetical protein [Demequina sp. SYSU T00b26]MDN4472890.1 hypothetical protein [Demequina sp. SYSU T00b26]
MADKSSSTSGSNPLAYVLWALVVSGLVYGVSMTAIRAAALFTG